MAIEEIKTYEQLEEDGFDRQQINQILKGYEENIDLGEFAHPNLYTAEDLRKIRRCAKPHHSTYDLFIIGDAVRKGFDLSFLENKLYGLSGSGLSAIIAGVRNEYEDIAEYTSEQVSYAQFKQIKIGMEKKLPLKYFYKSEYSPREIKFVVENLREKPMLKYMLDKKLKIQSVIRLMDAPTVAKFCDSSTTPDMVDAYKKLYDSLSNRYGVANEEVDAEAMDNWVSRLNNMELKFTELISNAKTPRQIKLVAEAIDKNLDFKKLHSDYHFTAKQMSIFLSLMKEGMDPTPIMKKGATNKQLDCIRSIYSVMNLNKKYKDFNLDILFNNLGEEKDMRKIFALYKDFVDLDLDIDINKLLEEQEYKEAVFMYMKLKEDDLFTKTYIYKNYGNENIEESKEAERER